MANPVSHQRLTDMLAAAFGPAVMAALADPATIEIMVNPDGALWIERHGEGRSASGICVPAASAERVIRLVASHTGRDVTPERPIVSAELPGGGERFEGVLPPVSPAPCFSIRKPASQVFTLDDYVAAGTMSPAHAAALKSAIAARANILVVGGTSSGKTTLANALLAEIATAGDRVMILEDTRELQCAAPDVVQLRTQPGSVTLSDLVRSTLRLRPDRIIIGEVRGAEALDMLKAWNTGHPGGLATLHANSAEAGLSRLEQLIGEGAALVPRTLIAEAVDRIVFIARRNGRRRVETVAEVTGLDADGYATRPVTADLRLLSNQTERTSPT